jgi:hypothetical protein
MLASCIRHHCETSCWMWPRQGCTAPSGRKREFCNRGLASRQVHHVSAGRGHRDALLCNQGASSESKEARVYSESISRQFGESRTSAFSGPPAPVRLAHLRGRSSRSAFEVVGSPGRSGTQFTRARGPIQSRRYTFALIGVGVVSLIFFTVFCEIDRQVTRLRIQLADEQTAIFDEMRETRRIPRKSQSLARPSFHKTQTGVKIACESRSYNPRPCFP